MSLGHWNMIRGHLEAYAAWIAKMAVGLNSGVPWIMCKEDDAPDPVMNQGALMYIYCLEFWKESLQFVIVFLMKLLRQRWLMTQVVTPPQNSLLAANSPAGLMSITEETLAEFLSKATGTAIDWVQMLGMKPGPDSMGIVAICNSCTGMAARAFGLVNLNPTKAYFTSMPFPVKKAPMVMILVVEGRRKSGVKVLLNYPVRGRGF